MGGRRTLAHAGARGRTREYGGARGRTRALGRAPQPFIGLLRARQVCIEGGGERSGTEASYEKWTHTDWRGVHYKCASLALRRRAPRPNDREAPPATMGRCRGISCLTHSDACGFWAPAISQSCQMRTEDIGPPRLCQHPEPIPWLDVGARAGHQMSESAHVRLGWLRWNGDAQTAACREPATGLPAQPTDTRLSSADRRRCWVRRCREARRRRCQPRWVGVGRCRVGAVGRVCVGRV